MVATFKKARQEIGYGVVELGDGEREANETEVAAIARDADPVRHGAVPSQARGDVGRHSPLALWILGRGHTHGESRHE